MSTETDNTPTEGDYITLTLPMLSFQRLHGAALAAVLVLSNPDVFLSAEIVSPELRMDMAACLCQVCTGEVLKEDTTIGEVLEQIKKAPDDLWKGAVLDYYNTVKDMTTLLHAQMQAG